MEARPPGQVVILNGTPRSGKSSIAAVIQETFDGPWMSLGADTAILAMTPPRYRPGIGPISGMLQYVNVWYTSESFSCWYQEVFTFYVYNWRADNRTTDYYSTPFYNWQYTWGYADSFSGDQTQIVSIGDESTECSLYGAGGGLHFVSGIIRNSSSAYTSFYGW